MTLHIISALVFFVALILTIIFVIRKNDTGGVSFGLIAFFMFMASVISGFAVDEYHNYRANHQPTFEDINNGYATQVTTYVFTTTDSIPVDTIYGAAWIGTNQAYEHYTNDVEETYYWKTHYK